MPEILNLVVSSFLVGLIWVIQLLVYPGFKFVAQERWTHAHHQHTNRITYLVSWLMPLELLLSASIITHHGLNLVGSLVIICLSIIWSSTFLVQVPIHHRLAKSFDINLVNLLVKTNWYRTLAWTFKLIFMLTLDGK